jgi:hypothetical protein
MEEALNHMSWTTWSLNGSSTTWIILDPTWDIEFGTVPGWLGAYLTTDPNLGSGGHFPLEYFGNKISFEIV